jgi:MFS family permease
MYSFGIILDDIKNYFDVSQDKANLITSLNTGFLFLSGPTVAGFSNKFSIRAVIMVGGVLTSALYVLCTFSPNIYVMMVSFGFLGGVAMGCTYLPSVWMVSLYFSKKRGIATGITMAGSGMFTFSFFLLVNYRFNRIF